MTIDTQGMTGPAIKDSYSTESSCQPFKPSKLSIFSSMEKEELKEMMREVLDEYLTK